MNKYLPTLLFYLASTVIIFLLDLFSPSQQDGGLGLGGLAIILFVFVLIWLIVNNFFKGLKQNKEHFTIAGIHFLILALIISKLFI